MKIDKYISKDAEELQDWKNLRVMFKFLEGHMKSMISKEVTKPKHFKKKGNNSASKKNHQEEDEEEKIDTGESSPMSVDRMDHYEEDKYEVHRQDSMQVGSCCQKYITPTDEKQENLIIFEGAHYFHKDCMKQSAKKQYLEAQAVKGVTCGEQVSTQTLNMYFESSFIDDLNEKLLRLQLMKENNMVECTCNNLLEVQPGSVDYKQKDEEGKVISRQAAENMAKFRVRCNNCNRVFCSSCNVEPYHVGKTCQEYEEYKGADKCRFGLEKLPKIRKNCSPAFMAVCRKSECESLMDNCCNKQLPCGHFCCGTFGEEIGLPCLDESCVSQSPGMTLDATGDDYCNVCYMSGLCQAPCIQLHCKHIFHEECLIRLLKGKWSGPRINFQYLKCPNCKIDMDCFHTVAKGLINEGKKLEESINKMALKRGKHEGIDKDKRLQEPPYNGNLQPYAIARLSYYMCFKCKKPYFGGLKSGENNQQNNASSFKPEELVGGSCSADAVGGGIKDCKKHGRDYIEFKCKFCCTVAQWFCWGNTHFGDDGHTKQNKGDYVTKKKLSELMQCKGKRNCPLKVDHPQNGKEEFALGCAICKNMKDNHRDY